MSKRMPMKDHIDAFNKIILDLKSINIKIEDEDRVIILLSSLPKSYESFVDTLLYSRESLMISDVKSSLNSKLLGKQAEGNAESLSVRGRPSYRDGKKKAQGQSLGILGIAIVIRKMGTS